MWALSNDVDYFLLTYINHLIFQFPLSTVLTVKNSFVKDKNVSNLGARFDLVFAKKDLLML